MDIIKLPFPQQSGIYNTSVQQNRLRWYGHVLRKDDNDWVKKCMEYEVVGSRPRGRPKRTWLEVVQRDCQVRGLSKDDAMEEDDKDG